MVRNIVKSSLHQTSCSTKALFLKINFRQKIAQSLAARKPNEFDFLKENEWFYYVIGLFYSSIIGNIFALGVHTIQIYPHLIHQVAIVLINDTLRLEIERVMLRGTTLKGMEF